MSKKPQKSPTHLVAPFSRAAADRRPVVAVVDIGYLHLHHFIEHHADGVGTEELLLVLDQLLEEAAVGPDSRPTLFHECVRL